MHTRIVRELLVMSDELPSLLPSTFYPLPSTLYPLPSTLYLLPTTHYPLLTTHYPLPSTTITNQLT